MASDQTRKRLANQGLILRRLRRDGETRRIDLSVQLDLRKSSVTSICRDLIDRGVLSETEEGAYRTPVALNPEYWKAGAIHIQAGAMTTAVVGIDGTLEGETTSPFSPQSTPNEILTQAAEQLTESQNGEQILGVGVSIPGITDPERGHSIAAVNLPNWQEVPVRALLGAGLDNCGITVLNDAACELFAHTWFTDYGSDLHNALYLCVGDGIGCAQIVNGVLSLGGRFAVGEIGCLPSGNEGRLCRCGKQDCLQTYCSARAIEEALVNGHPELAGKSLAELCGLSEKNPQLQSALTEALAPLVEKAATMIALTDPDGLVIGAEDEAISESLARVLSSELHGRLKGTYSCAVPVFPGLPCHRASLLGAAGTAFRAAFETQDLTVPR